MPPENNWSKSLYDAAARCNCGDDVQHHLDNLKNLKNFFTEYAEAKADDNLNVAYEKGYQDGRDSTIDTVMLGSARSKDWKEAYAEGFKDGRGDLQHLTENLTENT